MESTVILCDILLKIVCRIRHAPHGWRGRRCTLCTYAYIYSCCVYISGGYRTSICNKKRVMCLSMQRKSVTLKWVRSIFSKCRFVKCGALI